MLQLAQSTKPKSRESLQLTNISSKDSGSKVVSQSEAVNPVTETIEIVIRRQSRNKFYELVLIDNLCSCSVEDSISCSLSCDLKREGRIVAPRKLERMVLTVGISTFVNSRLRDDLLIQNVMRSVGRVLWVAINSCISLIKIRKDSPNALGKY